MQPEDKWEQAFNTLDKRVFSADSIGGYDFTPLLTNYINTDSSILDYGCGKGQMVRLLRNLGYKNVWGTDPSSLLLEHSMKSDPNLTLMADNRIPFANKSFDFVYCSGVLHHINWENLPNVLKEIRRVLKIGGHFLYAEPRNSFLRSAGHLIVMSPLNVISSDARALSDCLKAEWPTYMPWLKKQDKGFIPLCRQHGLKEIFIENRPVTTIGILQG